MVLCQCMKEADVVLLTNKNIASNAPLPTAPPIEPLFRSDGILATNQQEQKYLQQVTEIDTDSQNDVPSVDDKTSESAHGSDDWENLAIILPFDDSIKPAISRNSPMDIWNACEEGNLDKVTELLSDDHLLLMQLCPDTHKTPLYFASLGGNLDVMLFLLDKGAADDDGSCYLATSRAEARRLLLSREKSCRDFSHQTIQKVSEGKVGRNRDRNGFSFGNFICCG